MNLSLLFTLAFWQAAGVRAARTAVAVAVPLLPAAANAFVDGRWDVVWAALSTVTVAVLASLANSLAALPELDDRAVPLWRAVVARAARTLGQVIAATLVGATLLVDVAWQTLAWQVIGSVVATVLLGLISRLPETVPTVTVEHEPATAPDDPDGDDEDTGEAASSGTGGDRPTLTDS